MSPLLQKVALLLLTTFTCATSATDDPLLDLFEDCQVNVTEECVTNYLVYLNHLPNKLNDQNVSHFLNTAMNLTISLMNKVPGQNTLNTFGQTLLCTNKKLVSTVVDDLNWVYHRFPAPNLDVQVFVIRTQTIGYYSPQLTDVSVKINLSEIPKMNEGLGTLSKSAAVAFMSYTNMADILKPSFFESVTNANKTTVKSTVVSAALLKTADTTLATPVNFTLTHIAPLEPEAFLSCMDWETNTWETCILTQTNSSHTVCSCNRLTTFALISQTDPCSLNLTQQCAMAFLNQTQYNIAHVLPKETVKRYLTTIMKLTAHVNPVKQNTYGNLLMNVTEKLASALVNDTDTQDSINITLQNLEVQVFKVGPECLNKTFTLFTRNSTMDIYLTGISKNTKAAVAFMSYTNMADILEPSFNTFTDINQAVMSTVVSAKLLNTNNKELTVPVNFTLKHIKELAPENILSCMYWDNNAWKQNYCNATETSSSYTVCSCNRLGTVMLIMQTDPCMGYLTGPCAKNFLCQIPVNIPAELPQEIVKNYLNIVMNLTSRVIVSVSDQNYLISYGNTVLDVTKQLLSTLLRKTDSCTNISLSLHNVEFQVFWADGPNISLCEITRLSISNNSMDIDLVKIAQNNNGSAAVAFMSYNNMKHFLKPTLFTTTTSTNKTMMSMVVSASLPKTVNKDLTEPVRFTFKHIHELDPEGILSCVYWNNSMKKWLEDCSIIQTNSTHTVCSCDNLSTFALIMQTDPCRSDRLTNILIAVATLVGLVFLILSIITFTLYSRNPVTNAALTNLCINLLLFHILNLIKTLFLGHIHSLQLRAVLAGVQWFFLMSVFVWMFIEAVLLYIFVKDLSEGRSIQGEVVNWKWLIVIGYLIPLGVLGMSSIRFPKDYINEECWLNEDESLIFIFAAPLIFTVILNLIPYLIIIIIMISTLKDLKDEILEMRNTSDRNLIICVMFRSLSQFIILICYWILLYIPSKKGVSYHTFQFLNSQQGTFIFLVHCLLNQEVRQKYRKVLCAFCLYNNPAATTRSVRGQPENSQNN